VSPADIAKFQADLSLRNAASEQDKGLATSSRSDSETMLGIKAALLEILMPSTASSSSESTCSTLSSSAFASAAAENQLIAPNISPPATPRRVVPASLSTSLLTLTQSSLSSHTESAELPDQPPSTSSDRHVETPNAAAHEPENVIYGEAAAVEVCLFDTS
jgi:hypothetical protein